MHLLLRNHWSGDLYVRPAWWRVLPVLSTRRQRHMHSHYAERPSARRNALSLRLLRKAEVRKESPGLRWALLGCHRRYRYQYIQWVIEPFIRSFVYRLPSSSVILLKDNIVGVVIVFSLIIWVPVSCAISYYDKQKAEERRQRSASMQSDASRRRKAIKRQFSRRPTRFGPGLAINGLTVSHQTYSPYWSVLRFALQLKSYANLSHNHFKHNTRFRSYLHSMTQLCSLQWNFVSYSIIIINICDHWMIFRTSK